MLLIGPVIRILRTIRKNPRKEPGDEIEIVIMAESDPPSCGSEAAGLLSGGSYQVAFKEGSHSKKKSEIAML